MLNKNEWGCFDPTTLQRQGRGSCDLRSLQCGIPNQAFVLFRSRQISETQNTWKQGGEEKTRVTDWHRHCHHLSLSLWTVVVSSFPTNTNTKEKRKIPRLDKDDQPLAKNIRGPPAKGNAKREL